MSNYMYAFTVEDRGYADVDWKTMSQCELDKSVFIDQHLAKTLKAAKCGWENIQYRVMETPSGHRTEFLVLWAEEIGNSGSRWINVTEEMTTNLNDTEPIYFEKNVDDVDFNDNQTLDEYNVTNEPSY